jgi:uncharacterized coiled-coil DUF342 family protein
MENLYENSKKYLIELIEWYRDEYHKGNDDYHNELIERLRNATTKEEIDSVERMLDDWLDY